MEHGSIVNKNENSSNRSSSPPSTSRRTLPENAKPFVQMSVEELSLVQDLSYWTNTKVRCIGYLADTDSDLILHSCAEAAGQFEIIVDVTLMEKVPPMQTVIQLFGEICLNDNKVPFIKGCLYRNFASVDLQRYNRAIETVSRYFPWNIDMSPRKPSIQQGDREGSPEI